MPSNARPNRSIVPSVAIVVSRYNRTITDHLRDGAVRAYVAAGGVEADLSIVDAPGTYELPVLAMEAALLERYEGVVALGCVVRGETDHDRYISDAVAHALQQVALETGVPVGLGVLTCNNVAQAVARSGGKDGTGPDNKGDEAMRAVLGAVAAQRALRDGASSPTGVRFALDAAGPDKASPPARSRGASGGRASRSRASKAR